MEPFKIVNLGSTGLILKLVRNGGLVEFPNGNPTTLQQNTIATGFCISPDVFTGKFVERSDRIILSTIPMGVNGAVSFLNDDGVIETYRYANLDTFPKKLAWLNEVADGKINVELVDGLVKLTVGDDSDELTIRFIDEDVVYTDDAFTVVDGQTYAETHALYLGLSQKPADITVTYSDASVERIQLTGGTGIATMDTIYPEYAKNASEIDARLEKAVEVRFNQTVKGITGRIAAFESVPSLVIDITGPVGDSAFAAMDYETLVLGNHITTIGSNAFVTARKCLQLTVPDNVTQIGYQAFANWEVGQSLTIGKGTPALNSAQFKGWNGTHAKRLVIANGVTQIGDSMFANWSATELDLPNSLILIGDNAFADWHSATSLKLGNGAITIGNTAFANWIKATSLDLGGAKYIGEGAFSSWTSYDSSLTIPDRVVSIAGGAFDSWVKATGLSFNEGITVVGSDTVNQPGAFEQWTSATTLELANSITRTFAAFAGWTACEKLTLGTGYVNLGEANYAEFSDIGVKAKALDVVIPDSVNAINNAFNGAQLNSLIVGTDVKSIGLMNCDVKTLTLLPEVPPTLAANSSLPNVADDMVVYVNDVDLYAGTPGWNVFADQYSELV